ncbi:hypothetical protein TTHERM_000095382 (macronuclear) [Tetrahymena thermophila SB210]|uniref:Uncharacterized protein n=1 Tax=Tetrahymena thermophila (strain SB210) TaxID=312017 RepID=W7XKY8_TETTS|nr:hypothetical protein TTHERM_000095382 [Tetrahymena thermophila SB210]EWS75364.1 hypothetical protein TTHERM_000095382 [Tetrahymena thermophila SB210]|eukprot:XP_012652038.1 hypothetical protein TTHERM_000095382 [Tetrahymena thermophila SB210]
MQNRQISKTLFLAMIFYEARIISELDILWVINAVKLGKEDHPIVIKTLKPNNGKLLLKFDDKTDKWVLEGEDNFGEFKIIEYIEQKIEFQKEIQKGEVRQEKYKLILDEIESNKSEDECLENTETKDQGIKQILSLSYFEEKK